jgi:penicillin-binding protein 2
LIYDRHGQILARNKPVFSLAITPNQVPNLTHTLDELQKTLHLTSQEIQEFYSHVKQYRPYQSVPLRLQLNESEIARFYVNQYKFEGVSIQSRMIREYPLGSMVSSLSAIAPAIISAKPVLKNTTKTLYTE